jgi:hypothetical protein
MKKIDEKKSTVLKVISEIYKEDIDSELKDKLLSAFTDYVTTNEHETTKYITKNNDINKILTLMKTMDGLDKQKLSESNEKVKSFFDTLENMKNSFVDNMKKENKSLNPELLDEIGVTLPGGNHNID